MKRLLMGALFVMGCGGQGATDPSSLILATDGKADGTGRFHGQYQCPDGARFATNGSDGMFCIFENLAPPAGAAPYCNYLARGYVGYDWPSDGTATCADGGSYRTNGAGLSFCVYDVPAAPPSASAYCDYLADGYIGYSWSLCPKGARVADNGAGLSFCLFENLAVPDGARPYCDYLARGYLGYSFPETSASTCPDGFRYATNGAGLAFCLIENLALPAELDVKAYCDYLSSGYIGFSGPSLATSAAASAE